MPEESTIIESTGQSLDSFILLLERVGAWLWAKGVKQWAPGTFQHDRGRLKHFIDNGCLILAYQNDKLAGGCILSEVNPGWPESSDDSMYLSSLAVARFAAGQGLGTQIINVCTIAACKRGRSVIRLDCWEGNTFLKTYYRQAGFKMLQPLAANDYFIRLFEKEVTSLNSA